LPLWEGQQQHHSPSDQHFELKRLIQKILEEIAKLPELLNHSGLPLRPEEHLPYFDPKRYEQLLATAVLNKVVDDYRNPKNFTDTGDVAGKGQTGAGATPYGTVDINHNQLSETASHRSLLSKESLRQMSVTADDAHPHEGVSYSAPGERRLSDTDESYLSDYIQRHKVPLPDLSDTTGSGSGAEDDDLQSLKSNATDGTWEENWLFRKRQLKTTESSIAMLVPSPTEEVKALIGDKNADEISDLSEAGSDCEGYESDGNVNGAAAPGPEQLPTVAKPVTPVIAASSSKDTTSEGISSSSKTQDDSLDEILPPDSLVSINSLPVNEEILSEATNSQLLAEKTTQNGDSAARLQIDDLISIEPVADRVETTNPTLTNNPFLDDVFEPNNNVITDDVKLLQRTEAGESRSSTTESNGYGDRKEIPIDRAPQPQHHPHSLSCSPSNPVAVDSVVVIAPQADGSDSSSSSTTNGNGASEDSTSIVADSVDSRRKTNKLECFKQPEVLLLQQSSLSPPDSPVQQVLSPHPIMMTITDVFDRLANSSPLTAISEELPPAVLQEMVETEPLQYSDSPGETPLETISEECSSLVEPQRPVLSPADSMQAEQDESEYRTISEATNNSILLADSFDGLESFDTYEPANEEFCSLLEQNDTDRTPEPSPELLQIRETPPAALYVPNQEQLEFAEQMKSLEEDSTDPVKLNDPFERSEEDQPTRITLQPDLVTFDNNAPSPESGPPGIVAVTEQMRAYCEELKMILNLPDDPKEPQATFDFPPPPLEPEQWEMVESPETLEALELFQNELLIAVNDPTQTDVRPCSNHAIREEPLLDLEERFPSPIEVTGLQMAEYSDSLKNLEHVEEATAMDEETLPLPDTCIEQEGSPQAFLASSEETHLQPIVTVMHTPTTEPEPITAITSHECEEHQSPEDPLNSIDETMLTSIESRSESKIEDTSMPAFSDTEFPSLSSPFTSFSTNTTTHTNLTINSNNCMPTNSLTEQGPSPSLVTNPSNNTPSIVGESSPDAVGLVEPHEVETVADVCSIVPAQIETNGDGVPAAQSDTGEQDGSMDALNTLIPGSIAEREHLKWRNAKPIANNPYSPDALQRRLSEKARPTSMIEIDRLVRKEAAPAAGDAGVLIDDADPPKEPTDSGTENDRSLQSVTGGVLTETKKIGREYYINDPERLRAGGAPVKPTLGVSHQQQSHSTDDEKVSHQTYYTLPADSYLMDRFLNNAAQPAAATVGRSASIRSIRSLPQHELGQGGPSVHRPASVDLGYQTKTPSAAGSDTPGTVDIPAHILAQFEQETLHSDYKRDSFRARHATTRQFVLNPIFDEQASPGPEGTGSERTVHTLPRKSQTAQVGHKTREPVPRISPGQVVETVFTDLGTLRRSASSLLLGRNVEESEPSAQQKLVPDPATALYRSSSFGKQRDPKAEDIFAARPVQVTADDPILKQGTKVPYLSTPAREIYLVPMEPEPSGSLISTSSELSSVNSPTSPNANRPELDSLTYSEDSDVTRIYDLTTGEAKVLRTYQPGTEQHGPHDTILQILPQSPSSLVTGHEQSSVSALKSQLSASDRTEDRNQPRRSPFPVKPLSPETIKFFAPKRKLSFTGSTNSLLSDTGKGTGAGASEQGATHVLPSMHSSLHIDYPATRTATGSEFAIIEKDVIDVLPSVKELAKCYSGSTNDVSTLPPKPLYKPRDFIRQSSDVLNEEGMPSVGSKGQRQYSSTSSIAVRDEIREIRKLNLEAYRQSTYYPMAPGHSITARSLSKQIREHKTNVTDDHKVGHQEDRVPLPLPDDNGELHDGDSNEAEPGHASPERPASPVLLPGHLKSSIQFFESLKNKPEPTPHAVLPALALKALLNSSKQITTNGNDSILLPVRAVQLRSSIGNVEIGNSNRRNPLIPLKEIIDIPLVSRIIESPVQRPTGEGPIGDNLTLIPSLELPADTVPKDEKQAARLIVIRRRKMRKHKLKKLRKRMKFEWLKVRQRRELKKEKLFQAELLGQIKEAEKFSAEAYVAAKLRQATEVPLPRFWKGKRLPEFIIKQKLGME
uniref:DUF1713 domain-containing protein n=1 Tax=Anopheles epiroticus TaxID=199890 RepID=A0A182P2V9_9DIPT